MRRDLRAWPAKVILATRSHHGSAVLWRAGARWYHAAMRPVEEFFFFKRHGVVLWGKDTREQLTEPPGRPLLRVGFLCDVFELGGQEQGCLEVLRHLNRRRSKPYLYTFRAGKLLREVKRLRISTRTSCAPATDYLPECQHPAEQHRVRIQSLLTLSCPSRVMRAAIA